MNEVLGLLDALESIVLESKKIPLTENIIVEEKKLIDLIDKIRITVNTKGSNVRQYVDINEDVDLNLNKSNEQVDTPNKQNETDILEEAKKIKDGASDYAEYVLTSLQLTVTKMQNNLIKLEKNIESGRHIINNQSSTKNKNKETETIEK